MASFTCLDDVLRCQSVMLPPNKTDKINTHGNEQIWHLSLILSPGFAIFITAAVDVSRRPMSNHADKEDWVEPGERTPVLMLVVGGKSGPEETYSNPVIKPQCTANQTSAV